MTLYCKAVQKQRQAQLITFTDAVSDGDDTGASRGLSYHKVKSSQGQVKSRPQHRQEQFVR